MSALDKISKENLISEMEEAGKENAEREREKLWKDRGHIWLEDMAKSIRERVKEIDGTSPRVSVKFKGEGKKKKKKKRSRQDILNRRMAEKVEDKNEGVESTEKMSISVWKPKSNTVRGAEGGWREAYSEITRDNSAPVRTNSEGKVIKD